MKNIDIIDKYIDFCAYTHGFNILIKPGKHIFYNGYDIFSYGYHFKIATYDRHTTTWYINTDKFSQTTSKHTSMLVNSIRARFLFSKIEFCKFTNGVPYTFKDKLRIAKCIL
jgi:hypothetical protein